MRSVVLISLAVTFCLSLALRNFAAAQQLAESAQAQALIDQALALWEGTKRTPEPLPADYQAKALLERVVAEFPRTEQAADALRHLAYGHYRKGAVTEAEEYYHQLFTAYPTSKARARAWLDLNGFAYSEGDYPRATDYCLLVIEHFGATEEGANAKMDLGHCYMQMEKYEDALAAYERILGENPGSSYAVAAPFFIAFARWSINKVDALPALESVLVNDPDPGRRAYAALMIASAARSVGDFEGAVPYLEHVLADPTAPAERKAEARYTLAYCAFDLGDYEVARRLFAEVVEDKAAGPLSDMAAIMIRQADLAAKGGRP